MNIVYTKIKSLQNVWIVNMVWGTDEMWYSNNKHTQTIQYKFNDEQALFEFVKSVNHITDFIKQHRDTFLRLHFTFPDRTIDYIQSEDLKPFSFQKEENAVVEIENIKQFLGEYKTYSEMLNSVFSGNVPAKEYYGIPQKIDTILYFDFNNESTYAVEVHE